MPPVSSWMQMVSKKVVKGLSVPAVTYISENAEAKKRDLQVVEKVNHISDLAKELAESLQRKITVEELALETGLKEEEILEAIKFSGNKIEYFE